MKRTKKSHEFLDYVQTDQMKGLAILAIIIFHYMTQVFSYTSFPGVLSLCGPMGVGTFLLLSGYGLACSYENEKKITGRFFIKRIKRVLVPYWIVVIGIIIVSILLQSNLSFWYLAQLFFVINPPSLPSLGDYYLAMMYWFITYICIWYVYFGYIFWRNNSLFIKVCSLFLFAFLLEFIYQHQGIGQDAIINYTWAYYALSFPIGVTIGLKRKSLIKILKKLSKRQSGMLFFLIFIGSCTFFPLQNSLTLTQPTIAFLGFTAIAIVLLFSLWNIYSRFLSFMGTISYELFLVHLPFLSMYDFVLFKKPFFITFFMYLTGSVMLATLLHMLVKKLLSLKLHSIKRIFRNLESDLVSVSSRG